MKSWKKCRDFGKCSQSHLSCSNFLGCRMRVLHITQQQTTPAILREARAKRGQSLFVGTGCLVLPR